MWYERMVPVRWQDAGRLADSYGLLLAVILAQFLTLPFLDGTRLGPLVQAVLMGAMLLLAARISRAPRRFQRIAQVMVAISLVLVAIDVAVGEEPNDLVSLLLGALVFASPVVILRRIARHPVIDTRTVLGAICVYLLLGMAFAFIHHGLYSADPEAYRGDLGDSAQAGLAYFSFVTLATLGYGDITPVSDVARVTSVLESLTGQLFLVTLVAAVVANLGRVREPRS